jgi:hypothetical protein
MGVFKSPLQALYKQSDRRFSGGVSELGSPMPEVRKSSNGRVVVQEVHAGTGDPSTSSSVVTRLLHLSPVSPALQTRRTKLVEELFPLLVEAQELEHELIECRQKTLEEQLVKIRAQCRRQLGVVKFVTQSLHDAELVLMNAAAKQEEQQQSLQNMAALKTRGQHVPKWPTQDEIEAFESLYAEQQERVAKANEVCASALAARNEAMYKIGPAQKEMERLAFEEARLKAEVTKQPFVDLELGLDTVPSGYVTAD